MNAEDDIDRYFILRQRRTRASQSNVYNITYFTLMSSEIILIATYKITLEKFQSFIPTIQDYILQMIAIIIAFLISSFSQFIGHRLLYIISYTSYSLIFILIQFYGLSSSAWVLLNISRSFLYQQSIIQIYGMWPHKFGRIFAEFLIFYYATQLIIAIIPKHDENLKYLILIVMIVLNLIWLLCGFLMPRCKSLNDFRSPQNDTVLKDFLKPLFNIKIIIFTLLYFFSILSYFISGLLLFSYDLKELDSETFIITAIYGPYILSAIIVRAFVHIKLKPSLFFLISLITLISLLIIQSLQIQFSLTVFLILILIHLVVLYVQRIYAINIYGQILLNIGIRNVDLITSYQLIAYESSHIFYIYLYHELSQQIRENSRIINLSLAAIIFTLSFFFYQVLGFKQYIRNTNALYFERDRLQFEIV